ncbi:hypothetical protein ACN20G_08050 [Streptomyces sp. BI20]|uniref:hypothetical protein n=1 Tax=Streptomyces sp. BI20 TaxID=3403460 RepID=UPI003C77F38D
MTDIVWEYDFRGEGAGRYRMSFDEHGNTYLDVQPEDPPGTEPRTAPDGPDADPAPEPPGPRPRLRVIGGTDTTTRPHPHRRRHP